MVRPYQKRTHVLLFLPLFIVLTLSQKECRLWLAPSHLSTQHQLRWGIFAGVAIAANQTFSPEIAIVVSDLMDIMSRDHQLEDEDDEIRSRSIELLEQRLWASSYAGANWEANHSSPVLIPGIASLVNYHTGIANVQWLEASALLRKSTPDSRWNEPSRPHPARGAITTFDNMTLQATKFIPRGMELFADLFPEDDDVTAHEANRQPQQDIYQDRIFRQDYKQADLVIDWLLRYLDKHFAASNNKKQKDHQKQLSNDIVDFCLDRILPRVAGKRAKVIRNLIPRTYRQLQLAKRMGGSFEYRNHDMIKSQTWLNEFGLCMDNLQSGLSRIPEAGRGAFARRSFKAHEIIAPVPLLPIFNQDILQIFPVLEETIEDDDGEAEIVYRYDKNQPSIGKQLLLNYCFGHPESSLLLFPLSSYVSLINHAPLVDGRSNAYLMWSSHSNVVNDHSLHDMTIEQLAQQENPIMTMTLHALVDIEEGDEILIDYGSEWKTAWDFYKDYYRDYFSKKRWPLRAEDASILFESRPYPANMSFNPYPPGVATVCFLEIDDPDDGTPRINDRGVPIYKWVGPVQYEDFSGSHLLACQIVERFKMNDGLHVYSVVTKLQSDQQIVQVTGVPHQAIKLVDKPYRSDTFIEGAFRHYMGVRDQSFPQTWRNLR